MSQIDGAFALPEAPPELADDAVKVWREDVEIPTYSPAEPDRYPAYLERRVYQGSSGRVYPMPFYERIGETKHPQAWEMVHLENDVVRLALLPQLGGRIAFGHDKTRDYDFFYRNNVIKPALVGVLGPWISGGVEFNWPQHHRPATYLPTAVDIEREPNGAVTVWCADLDPFARMKATHGVRLTPGSSLIELRVRLTNRTDETQTFLWWANVAAPVGEQYQSFFPPDVHWVADHARRAVVSFPHAGGEYYGIDYPARVDAAHPDADRIDFYRNIPVPTSYMCLGSDFDFFGGYDHGRGAGFVHIADHRIAPGKKQWTWGNAPFGHAWDANLTDADGPYVELMAGVYTDNQPDFSFLAPGETKSFSQFWYPIQDIGIAHQANHTAALHCEAHQAADGEARLTLAVAASRHLAAAEVRVETAGEVVWTWTGEIAPGAPLVPTDVSLPLPGDREGAAPSWTVRVLDAGVEHLAYTPPDAAPGEPPAPAFEPAAPAQIATVEELYLTGAHLEQYRHATRSPEPYWLEALSRDPGDARSNVALAWRRYRAGAYQAADQHTRAAIARLTRLNSNPADSEAFYLRGLVLRAQGQQRQAYDAFAKAAWVATWQVPARLAMARLDLAAGRAAAALDLTDQILRDQAGQQQACALRVLALRRLGRAEEAAELLAEARAHDRLDFLLRDLAGEPIGASAQTMLDIALEYSSCGEWDEALRVLEAAEAEHAARPIEGEPNPAPLLAYHRAHLLARSGRVEAARAALASAREANAVRAFPMRLADAEVLAWAREADPGDARAAALHGHWLYAKQRYDDAIAAWQAAVELDDTDAVVRRNLGVAAYNVRRDTVAAQAHYDRALQLAPDDAKLWFERDQLAARVGESIAERLARLEPRRDLVADRDDLTVAFAQLLVSAGRAGEALELLAGRRFQPWEGGEGQVLSAWERTHLALSRAALASGDADAARRLALAAIDTPAHLGEARHPLANTAELDLQLGDALAAVGDTEAARDAWQRAAAQQGDFQQMATTSYSVKSYYSALAWRRLGDERRCDDLLAAIEAYAGELATRPGRIDYFATSLPTMLLFHDDLTAVAQCTALVLRAQVAAARHDPVGATQLLDQVFDTDPAQASARDLADQLARES